MDLQDDLILSKLDNKELVLYKEMLYLRSQLVSPPPMSIPFFSIEAVNHKTGKVEDKREGLMKTWVRNYSNLFAMLCCGLQGTGTGTFGDGHLNVKRTDGVIDAAGGEVLFSTVQAAFGSTSLGILIGRGPAGYSYEDFTLDNQIDHGVGVNEMLHYDMFNHVQTWVGGGTRQWTSIIKRYFVNRSGASIGVTEAALAKSIVILSRDIVAPTVDIDDDKACKVTYTIVSGTWDS